MYILTQYSATHIPFTRYLLKAFFVFKPRIIVTAFFTQLFIIKASYNLYNSLELLRYLTARGLLFPLIVDRVYMLTMQQTICSCIDYL